MKLSLVIPVYNEAHLLSTFFSHLRLAPLQECKGVESVELVCVEDGSTDGSLNTLQEILASGFTFDCGIQAQIKILSNQKNKGKGYSVRLGIKNTTGEIVIIQDADLEYSTSDYPQLINPISEGIADAVFGSRFNSPTRRVLFFWHAMVNHFLTLLSNMFSNLNLTDMETGYKAVKGSILRSLKLVSPRFGIEPEITARLARANIRLYEVPIKYFGRTYAEGKKIGPLDGLAAFFHVLRFNVWDTEPFESGVNQTLHSLDKVNGVIYAPLLEKALRSISIPKKRLRILEVGCGIGSLTQTLSRYGEVLATDINSDFLEELKNRLPVTHSIQTLCWDASLPLPSHYGSFDLIVAFNILEHLKEDSNALECWRSLLNSEGKMILLVPNSPKLYTPIDKALGHERRYDKKLLCQRIKGAKLHADYVFYGNALGILGWFLNGVLLKRSHLPRGQIKLYSLLKNFLSPIERALERYTGLSLIVVAGVQFPASQSQTQTRHAVAA